MDSGAKRNNEELAEIISKWTVDDILNEDLFMNQVWEIPKTFLSLAQYFKAFRCPFLEEVRAELASCLNKIGSSPRFDVCILEDDEPSILLEWSDGNVIDQNIYHPEVGDMICLSTLVPSNVMELKNMGAFSSFAFITDVLKCKEKQLKVKLCKPVGSRSKKRELSYVAVFLLRTAAKSHIWNALNVNIDDPCSNLALIRQTLHADCLVQHNCSCPLHSEFSIKEKLLKIPNLLVLNDIQIKLVYKIVSIMDCTHRSLQRISGFPGTGKTEIIAIVSLMALQMEQHKLVISAPNSFSVQEIVSRMMKLAGKNAFHASDIVLVGSYNNWPNLLKESPFACLDDLIVLLEPLFSETNGWKQVMSSLLDTLGRILGGEIKCHNLKEMKVSVVEKLRASAAKVSDYIWLILQYFPRSVLSEHEMICLSSLHATTVKMCQLCCDTVDPKEFCTSGYLCVTLIQELIDTINIPAMANSASIENLFLEHARIIFCPISDAGKLKTFGANCGLTVLVDRASEVKECDVLPLLQLNGSRHAFLFGGSGLSAAKISKNSAPTGFYRSLFGRLNLSSSPEYNLVRQYRMHPDISHFPNKKFFKHELVNSMFKHERVKPHLPECISGAYRFLDVSDGKEITDEHDMQPKNLLEAAVICKIALKTLEACSSAGKTLGIGVISPSPAQVSTIRTMLKDKVNLNGSRLWIKSIDEFYSSEEDILILSTVSSSHKSSCLRLLSKTQTLIYCLTRARKYLWIVGNGEIMKKSSSIWQEVVLDAEERGSLFAASRDKFLSSTIIKLKSEMNQLDHLLDSGGAHFDGTKWKVLFSNDFKKSFVAIQSTLTKKIIIAYIWRLASGWRPGRKSLYFSKAIKQFRVHGFTLICTTDIIKESKFIQTIKVWDVLTSLESRKLVQRLETMLSSFSECHLKLCKAEMLEGGLVVPMSWDTLPETVFREVASDHGPQCKSNIESVVDDFTDVQTAGLRFLKFYSLSSRNIKHLLTTCDGREIELPFEVSALEAEIISFPESAFILGRSGTGKTLVLLTKLVQREQQHMLAVEGSSSCKIETHIDCDHSEEEDCSADIRKNSFFQIFLTVNPILCSSVKDYIGRLKRYASGGGAPEKLNVVKAYDVVDSLSIFSEIPNSLTEIPRHNFPLVVSLLKFLLMLDGSIKDSFFSSFLDVQLIRDGKGQGKVSHVMEQLILSKEVDHDRFVSRYWPRFDVNLTRKLDPTMVFAQIVCCIKGENGSPKTAIHRNMSLEEYLELSKKRSSMFNKDKRVMIYKIFISYENVKKRNGEYDLADLVNNLHFRLSIYGYEGPKMDCMYIDEIQDFSMKQISLFKFTCNNFQSGYLFAGDTAQTLINDFRFEDTKCWFYQEFLSGNLSKPHLFQLTTNFRTHSGILELAESVLNLLYHFFPFSLDHLASEKSEKRGEIPIILKSANEEEVLQTIFNTFKKRGLEFGSEQVILVRSVSDKEKAISQIGNKALVLTIKECKGLEFQDVLLYNFCSSSSLKNEWRIVYKFMNHKNIASSSTDTFRDFDMDNDQVLCFELKQLYVALTRTRNRLWICESDDRFAKPLFDYWISLGLVHVQKLNSIFVERMEVECKKEDWAIRGKKGNYEMAIVCFKKAGDVYMSNWAKAASLNAEGSHNLHLNFNTAADTLVNAADIYLDIGKVELAAACYMKGKKYKKAGMLYLENFDEPRFEDAGDCFALAGNWLSAAKIYAQGRCLSKCLMACLEGLHFDLGFHFLKSWPIYVSNIEWIDFTKATVKSYYKLETIGSLMKFVKSFPDDLTSLLLKSGNFVEAAAIHRLNGDVLREIDVLQKAQLYVNSSNLMLSYALSKMLWMDGRKGWPLKSSSDLNDILENAISVAELVSNDNSICSEAKFLLDHTANLSTLARHIYNSKPFKNICTEFVACRKILEICLRTEVSRFYQERDFSIRRRSIIQDMLVEGHVSIQTLMFAWNLWKKHLEGILCYMGSCGTSDVTKYTKYEELCLKYFGVLKLDLKGFYVCYISKPSWMNSDGTSKGYTIGNSSYISSSEFNSLAKCRCLSEISYIGELLIQKLENLHEYLTHERSTVISQCIVAHHFAKAVRFCKQNKYMKSGSFLLPKMQNSLIQFNFFLFRTFFPLDTDVETTLKNLDSSLEDSATALVSTVLGRTFKSIFDRFEPMKTAKVLVYLLAHETTGKVYTITSEIVRRDFRWKDFFHQLLKYKSDKFHHSTLVLEKFLAVSNLNLESQLSLVEDVLFNTLLFETRKGWFIITCSGLSKFSKKQTVYSYQFQDLRSKIPENCRYLSHIYDFILSIACEMLHASHTHDKAKVFNFFRTMVQRVVVLISIVCLNSPEHYSKVKEILLEANGVLTGLPYQFFLNFWSARKCKPWPYKFFCVAFSKAMKAARDELLVVRFDDCTEVFDHLAPLYVDSHSTGQCTGLTLRW